MNIYKIMFVVTEEEGYTTSKKAFVKHNAITSEKIFVSFKDKSLLVPANSLSELNQYADYGGGIDSIEVVGTLSDKYFNPLIAEAEFVNNQIKSKKNGSLLGFQG